MDPGGVDRIVLVDDSVSQACTGGDRLGEIVGKDIQPFELEEGLIIEK
jgi:hypothetical protein